LAADLRSLQFIPARSEAEEAVAVVVPIFHALAMASHSCRDFLAPLPPLPPVAGGSTTVRVKISKRSPSSKSSAGVKSRTKFIASAKSLAPRL